ncbi:hypothetical protein [Streptomyces sp. NBC_01614]
MGLVFGFSDGEMTSPQEQGVQVESTFTVENGDTVTDTNGNTYSSTASND